QEETCMTDVVDPWGGSYYVEKLTDQIMEKAWKHMEEIEDLGGMAKAIETGIPKLKIEEAAAKRQAQIDSKTETIIGMNRYPLEEEDKIDMLHNDKTEDSKKQMVCIEKMQELQDDSAVEEALNQLTEVARTGEGNLLAYEVKAERVRATIGEISDAIK